MAFLAAAAAVISYLDGLYLVHLAGAAGRAAYLYPLLPDGLIVISAESIYDAGQCGQGRPRWATTGIAFGAVLTVAMNVAAGAGVKVPLALVDGVVPVVFFVALEILIGLIRRGRGGAFPGAVHGAVPVTSIHSSPPHPPSPLEALAALVAAGSQRKLGELLGVPKSRVQAWAAMVREVDGAAREDVPAGDSPGPQPVPGRGAGGHQLGVAAGDTPAGGRIPHAPPAGAHDLPAGRGREPGGQLGAATGDAPAGGGRSPAGAHDSPAGVTVQPIVLTAPAGGPNGQAPGG